MGKRFRRELSCQSSSSSSLAKDPQLPPVQEAVPGNEGEAEPQGEPDVTSLL